MSFLILVLGGVLAVSLGSVLGYYARRSIAAKKADSAEHRLQLKVAEAEKQADEILSNAKSKAKETLQSVQNEEEERRKSRLKAEQLLLRRENVLDSRISEFEKKEQDLVSHQQNLKKERELVQGEREKMTERLEKIAGLTKEEARKELFARLEEAGQRDLASRLRKLETEGEERFERRAKEILAYAIQRIAVSQTQEISTSTVILPSEDIKGKIIGKEGRNIRALERMTGVEIVVDEAPETVVISGFDPVRRHIAKVALERLIKDGRIHPARVEEVVAKAEEEIDQQMREAGEAAIYDAGLVGIDPKLVQLVGRLRFRTSYGQNVLMHSIEVAHLASALASEIGGNVNIAKKAGLLHDIGKALDHQVEGSHVDIGMRVLEKFGVEKEVIDAMKSHHEDYPYESIEAVIVQTADAISGARPGARKDSVEHYLKRIGELETLASSFEGVEKVYAIQAGREIRIFVRPDVLDDLKSKELAREIAKRVEEELRYPGEIKVTVIRENRFVEHAR